MYMALKWQKPLLVLLPGLGLEKEKFDDSYTPSCVYANLFEPGLNLLEESRNQRRSLQNYLSA